MSTHIPTNNGSGRGVTESWCYSQFPTISQMYNTMSNFISTSGGIFIGSVQLGLGSSISET